MTPPLLRRFPELTDAFPWIPLLPDAPTPVTHFPERGLWVKRDDLACPRYGGNKARKFEWILGELKARGASSFVTFGGLCSNHCTAAAIYGRGAGLDVRLVFVPTPVTPDEVDELRLQAMLGARQAMAGPRALSWLRLPIVPPAGSTVAGILGYVNAGLELAEQIESGDTPLPRRIVLAAATGGTALGLAMGLALAGLEPMPRVVLVETVTPAWQRARVLLPTPQRALDKLRRISENARRRLPASTDRLSVERVAGFDREPLGVVTPRVAAALEDAATVGLTLDAHFSARAWAALEPDGATLFWHTHGHAPAERLAAAHDFPLPPQIERRL